VKAGKIDFRVDKAGIIHASIRKVSFEANEIRENAIAFLQILLRLRPASAKGLYVRNATMSSTMGPGIPISRSSVISV